MENNKFYVVKSSESSPMVDTLRTVADLNYDEVLTFFSFHLLPRSLGRQARCIRDFCDDTPSTRDDVRLNDLDKTLSYGGHHPIAWVSDRNWHPDPPKSCVDSHKPYDRVLGNKDLLSILQTSRVSINGHDVKTGPPRRIYINKPDGCSILALIRTTPPSQVPGFRELLANYITEAPKPVMSSREIFWWGSMSFVFSFNLPFFAISTQSQQDTRALCRGKRPLRARYDLSFLQLENSEHYFHEGVEPSSSELFLLEGVCSVVVTGQSSQYWTAACLNDDLYDDMDEPRLSTEEDTEPIDGETDPIILKVDYKPQSPRAYALAALATTLAKIVDYHKDIQDAFGTSLSYHATTPLNVSLQTRFRTG
ncbi:hypothetical protein F53441_215 [Fusarium austroafricanum]|uniref:Uncharacterized protein n=1 Tax=Fusarium austroafricanum TaxID=2364996 RepID=A0A8H4KUZ0_9HYPO|nr:hypothetical protein F53441_215 [Fusarium austroafricanum]